jgi:hypothetical protein
MLYDHNDQLTFLEHKGWWFLWESAWDSFRPDQRRASGTGPRFVCDDREYCSDPTGPPLRLWIGSHEGPLRPPTQYARRYELPVKRSTACVSVAPSGSVIDPLSLTACAPRDHGLLEAHVQGQATGPAGTSSRSKIYTPVHGTKANACEHYWQSSQRDTVCPKTFRSFTV